LASSLPHRWTLSRQAPADLRRQTLEESPRILKPSRHPDTNRFGASLPRARLTGWPTPIDDDQEDVSMSRVSDSGLTRRDFLGVASATGAATVLTLSPDGGAPPAAAQAARATWQIGCHSRPFGSFRAAQTDNPDYILDSVKGAGYQYADMISAAPPGAGRGGARGSAPATAGGGGRGAVTVTPEMIAAMKQKLAARGLKSNIASLPTTPRTVALGDAIAAAQRVVANAHALGQRFALNLGIYDEELWLDWCKVMREAAAYGQERGVKVVVKHHHGLNNTSLDLLAWVKQVNHPNFGVFVDPGNIVYYTGRDAVKQTAIIASHVAGVVAKDCTAARYLEREAGAPAFGTAPSAPGNPEVMIQFGTGKVDFPGLFKVLKEAGFNGPVMVEGTAVGATLQETVANARANREFLEKIFASL
jgi:sugar phosphate isomerase/epimerase